MDGLFALLDAKVRDAQVRLAKVQLQVDPGNPDAEALIQRETEYHRLHERLDQLNVAQLGLVFGRIDVFTADERLIDNPVVGRHRMDRRYIGRMGLEDRSDSYRSLLLDWRAPLARPFYLATTAQPEGVELRRHIRMRGRVVVGVDDEVLSGDGGVGEEAFGVAGESALFQAIRAARTGRMGSIVETIQREQDEIIRDETRGVMVVVGGPGTGKTAVALHRVAYLLYTWRDYLSRTGVLIIGPNRTFLDYISHVLPELGETGVVLSTVGELFSGVVPVASESLLSQEVKGSLEMVTILKRLVQWYQLVPEQAREFRLDGIGVDISPAMVKAARARARRSRRPHNDARAVFVDYLAELVAAQVLERIGADPLGGTNLLSAGDAAQLHDDVLADGQFGLLVNEWWPVLSPTKVLAAGLTDRAVIAEVAFDYDDETQAALYREVGDAWTASDAALLDELAQLIGVCVVPEEPADAWESQVEEAQVALDILSSSASSDLDDETDAEVLSAFDVVDAEELARRQEVRDQRSTAERAQADSEWAYGHVIVDEAQELSAMAWRMVMRRCPSRWMTLVGDVAQTGSPAGVDSWAETLSPFVAGRFKTHQLSVNYRTPVEVMGVANEVLEQFAPNIAPSVSLRTTGVPVRFFPSGTDVQEVLPDDDRLTAVIAAHSTGEVHGVADVKGLEFDHVIVVDPQVIVAASPQGYQDLFVAMTRATQSLTIIGELPVS